MKKRKNSIWILAVLVLMIIPAAAMGQLAADVMSFQAQLKDNGGNPVPDDTYTIDFSIWDDTTSGTMLWTEQRSVTTSDGYFQLYLGEVTPLDQDVFGGTTNPAGRWLQFQVTGDVPMTPRSELGANPFSFISTRMYGDIKTEPGVVSVGEDNSPRVILDGTDSQQSEMIMLSGANPSRTIGMIAHETGGTILLADPRPSPAFSTILINGDDSGGSISLADPRPSPTFASIDIFSGDGTGSISLADPRPSPSFSTISLNGNDGGGSISLADPRPSPEFASIDLFSGGNGGSISLADPRPSPIFADVTISGDATGSGILLADPRPSPSFGSLQLRSDATGSSVALADPRPSPSVPDLLLVSDQTGSELAFGEVSGLGLIDDEVMILNAVPTGGSISLISPNNISEIGLGADDTTGTNFFVRNGGAVALVDPKGDPVQVNLILALDDNTLANLEATALGGCIELNEPNSQAQITAKPSGINIYDSEGAMAAVFEPNGVEIGKGNIGSGNTNAGTNTLVSGQGNSAGGNYSAVVGGSGNSASGGSAAVVGGVGNSASFGSAFVGAGQNNNAGGSNSSVVGGSGNSAGGTNAVIPGGASNIAGGDYSFAAGLRAHADHNGSFVWADASGAILSSEAVNQLKMRAAGGTYIFSNSTSTTGVSLTAGSSMWAALSDRNAKKNIRSVDYSEILDKLNRLDISRWSYKEQDEDIEHIGPMAQDFYALFGIGEDDKHISTLDPSGVALSAIKALLDRIEQLETRISELEKNKE